MQHILSGVYEKYVKRPLDLVFSGLAFILLSPFLIIIALLIKMDMGSPVIFKQRRIGLQDKEFTIYKFRSMTDTRDKNGIFLPDDMRLTRLGRFIRRTSIDELPSLINIIRGDMAIIGPRPLPVRYLSRYTPEQRRRHEIRPGLSDPATVNGRNRQSWEQQFAEDVWYVDHVSFLTDVKTIGKTIQIVLNHRGVVAEDGGAREEFIGIEDRDALCTDREGNYMKL